jgi:peroxidase
MLYRNNGQFGMDAVSLDIQRGRDHGLPGYNHYRKSCGLPAVKSFDGFLDVMSKSVSNSFLFLTYTHTVTDPSSAQVS